MTDPGRQAPCTEATSDSRPFADRLCDFLFDDRAPGRLVAYFAEPAAGQEAAYTGRHFERFAGGGDRPDRADAVTAEDLVAVQTLSVVMPPETSVQLLEGHLGVELSRLLRQIPADLSLGSPGAAPHLADGSPADRCWWLLKDQAGVGATLAGKLLARKRPRLLPVYDGVVACALGRPPKFWQSLHDAISSQDLGLRPRLEELEAHVPDQVSHLRILDVVIWMAHSHDHRTVCTRRRAAVGDRGEAGA